MSKKFKSVSFDGGCDYVIMIDNVSDRIEFELINGKANIHLKDFISFILNDRDIRRILKNSYYNHKNDYRITFKKHSPSYSRYTCITMYRIKKSKHVWAHFYSNMIERLSIKMTNDHYIHCDIPDFSGDDLLDLLIYLTGKEILEYLEKKKKYVSKKKTYVYNKFIYNDELIDIYNMNIFKTFCGTGCVLNENKDDIPNN